MIHFNFIGEVVVLSCFVFGINIPNKTFTSYSLTKYINPLSSFSKK